MGQWATMCSELPRRIMAAAMRGVRGFCYCIRLDRTDLRPSAALAKECQPLKRLAMIGL